MDVAIVGVSFELPKSKTNEELSSIFMNGKDTVSSLNYKEINKINSAYLVDGYKDFDASFFGYSSAEVRKMDPQHRKVIEMSWQVLDEFGFLNDEKLLKDTGVFTSLSVGEYLIKNILGSDEDMDYSTYINNIPDSAATKVAYKFNFQGNALNINTACSSGISAINTAINSLKLGNIKMALVCGSKLGSDIETGYTFIENSIFSSNGKCSPLSDQANGIVPGNGTVAILLKDRLEAIKDKDNILAVIKNISINNDGNRKVGFTSPSIEGQINVMENCYKNIDLSPNQIKYLELHGTGTKVGDAIETRSVSSVFNQNEFYVGSSKSNFGHTDTVSALCGLLKCIWIIQNQVIPKQANFENINPLLEMNGGKIKVCTESIRKEIDFVALNSFGIGGTNGHLILEKYEELAPKTYDYSSLCVPIYSKRSETHLNHVSSIIELLNKSSKINIPRIFRTLLFNKKQYENVSWIKFNSSSNKFEQTKKDVKLSLSECRKNEIELLQHSKFQVPSETLIKNEFYITPLRTNKRKSKDAKNVKNDILCLIANYSNNSLDEIRDTKVSEFIIESFLLVELLAKLKERYYLDIKLHDFMNSDKNFEDFISDSLTFVKTSIEENSHPNRIENILESIKGMFNIDRDYLSENSFSAFISGEIMTAKILNLLEKEFDCNFIFEEDIMKDYSVMDMLKDIDTKCRKLNYHSKHVHFLNGFNKSKKNLFLFHPAGGSVYGYKKMFNNHFYRWNIVAISFPIDHFEEIQHFNLIQLATYYKELIQLVNGKKEFHLCGYSFGGNIAFEIARQLEDNKQIVKNIILIDSHPIEAYFSKLEDNIDSESINLMKKELLGNKIDVDYDLEKVWIQNHLILKKYHTDKKLKSQLLLLICLERENPQILESLNIKEYDKVKWQDNFVENIDVTYIQGNHYSIFSDEILSQNVGNKVIKYLEKEV